MKCAASWMDDCRPLTAGMCGGLGVFSADVRQPGAEGAGNQLNFYKKGYGLFLFFGTYLYLSLSVKVKKSHQWRKFVSSYHSF
jgi:hypothetical protein